MSLNHNVNLDVYRNVKRQQKVSYAKLPPSKLRRSEKQVIALILKAKSNKEIAEELHIKLDTVGKYMVSIMRKLEVDNRVRVALWGLQNQGILNG